ncbi:DUF2061 domain-containing protein [Candidatus Pacearchaeota archaeon]|nr:DUF2061 domain-containing protein [Candidatus Pacearchaeota archaeon]
MKERKRRSIFKSITWRICATITTVILVYIFTGELALALSLGIVEVIVKMIVYYVHERVWIKVRWGLKK